MAVFRHIQTLLLILPFTALTEEVLDMFVRADDDVLLNCDKVQDGQDQCERTTWFFSNIRNSNLAEEIIRLGRFSPGYRHKSHRFTVTQNCSLSIKNVEMSEGGRFDCRQFDQSGREVSDATVVLTVVAVTELMDDDDVTLNCFVFSHHSCSTLRVRWIYNDSVVNSDQPDIRKNERICGASLSFHPSYYSGLKGALFECEVTHKNQKHRFKLRPERPEMTTTTIRTVTTTTEESFSSGFKGGWWYTGAKAVGLSALMLTTVSVVVWTWKNKKQQKKECETELEITNPPRNVAGSADYENQ